MRRSHQITSLVMLAALVAVAVGVAVWPTPEEAWAIDMNVVLTVDWGDADEYDIQAMIHIYDINMQELIVPLPLTPNAAYTEWTATVPNLPTQATFWGISFDGGLLRWDPAENPFTGEIDWENLDIDPILWCLGI